MRPLQRFLIGLLVLIGLMSSLLTVEPSTVSATTGPSEVLPPSRYKVSPRVAIPYLGAYKLKSVAQAARISRCAFGIEVNKYGFLFGLAQLYGYDLEGYQTLWVSILYNFHQTAKGVMVFDLLAPGTHTITGRMFVTRSKRGDLSGQIELTFGTYAISFHKISNQWSPANA
jgi:hypothetical protein